MAPSKEAAKFIFHKLKESLSDGKDSIIWAISNNVTDDANKILVVAEADALVGVEGYSHYESYEVFHTLNNPRTNLLEVSIANLVTVSSSILSAGLGWACSLKWLTVLGS